LYRTVNGSRSVHDEHGPDFYHFPNLSAGLSEEQTSEPAEKGGFRISCDGKTAAPAFSAIFDTEQEKAPEAKDPVETIEAQADQIREQGYAKGFVDGRKVGEEVQKGKLKEALKSLHAVMAEFEAAKAELYQDAERQAVELALMIARKIVCREVSIDRDMIFRVLREALKKVNDQKEIHVKMHPSDLQAVEEAGFAVSRPEGHGPVFLEPGDDVCRGECVIETDFGAIDARMESQLQTVEESLRLMLQDGTMAR
jgi:flagellar assembly protein FliH